MKQVTNASDEFIYNGKQYTAQTFAEIHNDGDLAGAIGILAVLNNKGRIREVQVRKTPEQKDIEKATEELEIRQAVATMDTQTENYRVNKQNSSGMVHKRVDLEFPNVYAAQEAELELGKAFGLKNMEVKLKNGLTYLVIRNVDDRVLAKIERRYTTNKAIEAGLNMASSSVDKLSGAIDYTAQKILAPGFQIGAKGSIGIIKSLIRVASKTGATLITATSQGAKQTAAEIKRDPDIARAKAELLDAKDFVTKTVSSLSGQSKGIYIANEEDDDEE